MCYLDIFNKNSDLYKAIDSFKTSTSDYIKIKRGNDLLGEYRIIRTMEDIERVKNEQGSKDRSALKNVFICSMNYNTVINEILQEYNTLKNVIFSESINSKIVRKKTLSNKVRNYNTNFSSCVFLGDFFLSDRINVVFDECEFLGSLEIKDSSTHISSRKYDSPNKLIIKNCKFFSDILIKNINDIYTVIDNNTFSRSLFVNDCTVSNRFIFTKNTICSQVEFRNTFFEEHAKFTGINIEETGLIAFEECFFSKTSEIFFDKLVGKIKIYKTSFSSQCYLDYEELSKNNYSAAKIEDINKTKWTFFHLAEIYRRNGKSKEYLETYYNIKYFESKNKNGIAKLLDLLLALTTMYFTSWKRVLISSSCIILIFSIIYILFLNMIFPSNQNNIISYIQDMVSNNSEIDCIELIKEVFEAIGKGIVFSGTSFLNTSLDGVSVKGWMNIIKVCESALGVFMMSSLVATITRKLSI